MKKQLDKNTFGDSKAEIALVVALNRLNNSKITGVVGTFLGRIDTFSKKLSVVDKSTKQTLYNMIRKDTLEKISKWPKCEDGTLYSLVTTCAITKLRRHLLR